MNTASRVTVSAAISVAELMTSQRPPYNWDPEYQEALLETDNNLLAIRIKKAEHILTARRSVLNPKEASAEIHDLEDALRALRILKNQS